MNPAATTAELHCDALNPLPNQSDKPNEVLTFLRVHIQLRNQRGVENRPRSITEGKLYIVTITEKDASNLPTLTAICVPKRKSPTVNPSRARCASRWNYVTSAPSFPVPPHFRRRQCIQQSFPLCVFETARPLSSTFYFA